MFYIGPNYDYILSFLNSYEGNKHDSRMFPEMVKQMPDDSIIIFDNIYNTKENVNLLHKRIYIGSLILSDHRDLAVLAENSNSFT